MARTDRGTTTTFAILLAGAVGAVLLAAGPVGAQTTNQTSGGAVAVDDSVASGTCVATDGSVCSGSGRAANDSTSSGSAVAVDGSVSSGCATAVDDSTASGAPCPRATTATTRPAGTAKGIGGARQAPTATPTGSRALALTGSNSGELAAGGGLALLAGALLVRASRRDGVAPPA